MAAALATVACGASAAQTSRDALFRGAFEHRDDAARYAYLVSVLPSLAEPDKVVARQLLASTENELGLYSEAVRDFPLQNRPLSDVATPRPEDWQAVDAVEAIAEVAGGHRLLLVNEAHHDGHTRILTLGLLPALRARGYRYLALEALDQKDEALAERGYPVPASGSEYVHDPLYGEIVRQALALGYVVVPYEATDAHGQRREDGQARNIYDRIFAHDPAAKVLVHAGYAHIDKKSGRLGPRIKPMAMALRRLTGIEPLSIDQTDIREDRPVNEIDAIHRAQADYASSRSLLTARASGRQVLGAPSNRRREYRSADLYYELESTYRPDKPVLLVNRQTHAWWTARPGFYDANVILPHGNDQPSNYGRAPINLHLDGANRAVLPAAAEGHRPRWLALGGARKPVPVESAPCDQTFPCLVEAHYVQEPDDAVAADRYLFLEKGKGNLLYLRPGAYRLRWVDVGGKVLSSRPLEVPAAR